MRKKRVRSPLREESSLRKRGGVEVVVWRELELGPTGSEEIAIDPSAS